MSGLSEATLAAMSGVLESGHHARPDDIPAIAARAGAQLGAAATTVLLVDLEQRVLVPLGGARPTVAVEGTMAGRCFADVSVQESRSASYLLIWAPLLDGTERLGVVEFAFPTGTAVDDGLRNACRLLTALLAELTVTRVSYGDLIDQTRRLMPMSLPAEIAWNLLPPLTFATERVVISGVVSPCYEVGGDSFDYAVNADVAHLAVFDAMGHGLEATLLSAVSLGAYRNARRCGLDLVDTVRSIDRWLASYFSSGRFVTAIVGELDLLTGVWRWVTAGHPPALLLRRGRIVKTLDQFVEPPLGLLTGRPALGEERLEPGDRLLMYTDGVTEARDATGAFFGVERLGDFVAREASSGLVTPEVLRRLNQAILAYQEGRLQDDATTLAVEWCGEASARLLPTP